MRIETDELHPPAGWDTFERRLVLQLKPAPEKSLEDFNQSIKSVR